MALDPVRAESKLKNLARPWPSWGRARASPGPRATGPARGQCINRSRTRIRHSHYGCVSESALVSIPPVKDSGPTLLVSGLATTAATVQHTLNFPISGVLVPDLGHSPGAWKRAIKQWEEYDTTTKCALKDWPKDWYTGVMRTVTGSKRSQQQIVFKEYERYLFLGGLTSRPQVTAAAHQPLYYYLG